MNIKRGHRKLKIFTYPVSVILILSTLFLALSFNVPIAEAASVNHTVGNVDINILTDYGRILQPLSTNGPVYQTVRDGIGFGFIGLVVDQDNYVHTPGLENIADCYDVYPYVNGEDFAKNQDIAFLIDDSDLQKSFGSFINTGVGTGDPNDIQIDQTAWTVKDKDWTVIQWTLTNLKPTPISGVCLGLEVQISKLGTPGGGGLGGDNGDDVDGFDSTNSVYWASDDTGTTIGFASALTSEHISHYYSEDYEADYNSQYKDFFADDNWLYTRLHAPNATATNGITPKNITSTIGWNYFDLGVGASKVLSMVIAINNSISNMITAVNDARYYYEYKATGVQITEISDSGGGLAKIEVFNNGRPTFDVSALTFSADAVILSGGWSVNPIQTYGYSVFTVNEVVDSQGATIDLYENAVLADSVSFGQKGTAPDPLDGESTSRYYDPSRMGYLDMWVRNSTGGPTWDAQNDVADVVQAPYLVLNDVMFNPTALSGAYITILNTHQSSTFNLRNFYLDCNDAYQFPDVDIFIEPNEELIVSYSDTPLLFQTMVASSDNVYFYDDLGRLLDMFGWSSAHLVGMSARRVPDGSGTFRGYNDVSSESAGWVFNTPNQVIMTEISDSSPSKIEVYNKWNPSIDFNGPFTFESVSSGTLTGTWSIPVANAGEHAVFDVTSGLNTDGDTVRLYQNGYLIEEVSYGTKGLVPDPLTGESVQRHWDGSAYSDLWLRNFTTGPNFGTLNNVPTYNFTSSIKLNEVLFNPSVINDYFVEIINLNETDLIDISGYKIVCDSAFTIPNGTIMSTTNNLYYLLYSMDSGFFNPNMGASGDNVYLYDEEGLLVDMVGWSSAHVAGESLCRVPDGNGTRDGYDDVTSVLAEWQFGCIPTVSLIEIDVPQDNRTAKYGDFGEWVEFNLTVWNHQDIADLITISFTTQEGWPVEIYDETGTILITDITVVADGINNFTVKAKIPDTFNFIVEDNITILIQSTNSGVIRDSIVLTPKVQPFVRLFKYAYPTHINIEGTGYDEETTITLAAEGSGAIMEGEISNAADIVFVVDDTGSMGGTLEPLRDEIKNIVQVFLDEIASVRLGLVSYKDEPETHWDCPLTFKTDVFIAAVNALTPTGGGNWTEEVYGALNLAITADWRNTSVTKVIILIGDAPDHDPPRAYPLVNKAKIDEWGIYTNAIACGDDPQTIMTFQKIAENGSGIFYNYHPGAMDPEALAQAIIEAVLTFIPGNNIAALDLDVFDSNPMIRDVLPPDVHYVPGSATISPHAIYTDSDNNTVLEWNVSAIAIGQNWTVSFNVTSSRLGVQLSNVVQFSRINYTAWDDENITVEFPEVWIDVFGYPTPPEPRISVIPGTNHVRLEWVPPNISGIHHYLIYRTTGSPTTFDFNNPYINTSLDTDPLSLDLFGPRTTWNFTEDVVNAQEIYYCIRTVNDLSQKSSSSYTVGKWTQTYSENITTFSIPLDPFDPMTADEYLIDMGADYIKWMDPTFHVWRKHGEGVSNDTSLRQGEGYQVKFPSQTKYTFCGKPAAMIIYNPRFFEGFDFTTESDSLIASSNSAGDVTLIWTRPGSMDSDDNYLIYRSTTRDGFFDGSASLVATISYGTEFWIDSGVAQSGTQFYYMIIPENEMGQRGTGTYSIGVWTEELLSEYDTIGIPVKVSSTNSASWYCKNIPDCVGINYYINNEQRWGWHLTIMPQGVFDIALDMGYGYQISTSGASKFTFIGI